MRYSYNATLAAVLFLEACSEPTAPPDLVDLDAPVAAAATVTHDVVREGFSDIISVPCLGEIVAGDFEFNLVLHTTINGNRLVSNVHGASRFRGVGVSTGTLYESSGPFQETITGSLVNGHFSYTQVSRTWIVSHGSAGNFALSLVFHVTLNAQNEATVEFLRFDEVCR